MVIAFGLLIQASALALLFRQLRGRWLTRVGAVFIVVATVYHGVNEVLLWIDPGRDPYRLIVGQAAVEAFVIWISVAIFLVTVGYVVALGRLVPSDRVAEVDREALRRAFDWRLVLVAVIPLMVLTIQGNGFAIRSAPNPTPISHLETAAGLATQFLLPLLVLLSFGVVLRFGMGWFLPALAIQSLALAITGQRLEALIAAVLLVYALRRVGAHITTRQWAIALLASMVVGVVITSARASEGRLVAGSGQPIDLTYLVEGVTGIGTRAFWDQLGFDVGYRLDGNSFGAMELNSLNGGLQPLGIQPLFNDIRISIPSFLNPAKSSYLLENLSEKEYAEIYLDIPLPIIAGGAHQDILPTQLGETVGYSGPWGMLLIALLVGICFAFADRWILELLTPYRIVIGLGLMECVLYYERSWDIYLETFRGVVVLLIVIWLIARLRSVTANQKPLEPVLARIVAERHTMPVQGPSDLT